MNEVAVAILVLAPLLGGLAVWRMAGRRAELIAETSLGITAVAALALASVGLAGGRLVAFAGLISIDALGAYILSLTAIVACLAMAASPRYIRHELAAGALLPQVEGR